jgi:hypothetical protein
MGSGAGVATLIGSGTTTVASLGALLDGGKAV